VDPEVDGSTSTSTSTSTSQVVAGSSPEQMALEVLALRHERLELSRFGPIAKP
jgi:hypothetical protein